MGKTVGGASAKCEKVMKWKLQSNSVPSALIEHVHTKNVEESTLYSLGRSCDRGKRKGNMEVPLNVLKRKQKGITNGWLSLRSFLCLGLHCVQNTKKGTIRHALLITCYIDYNF